jgi:hypothetical protein
MRNISLSLHCATRPLEHSLSFHRFANALVLIDSGRDDFKTATSMLTSDLVHAPWPKPYIPIVLKPVSWVYIPSFFPVQLLCESVYRRRVEFLKSIYLNPGSTYLSPAFYNTQIITFNYTLIPSPSGPTSIIDFTKPSIVPLLVPELTTTLNILPLLPGA